MGSVVVLGEVLDFLISGKECVSFTMMSYFLLLLWSISIIMMMMQVFALFIFGAREDDVSRESLRDLFFVEDDDIAVVMVGSIFVVSVRDLFDTGRE